MKKLPLAFLLFSFFLLSCRSELIYENGLTDHSHDLALKMSLKIAREKAGADFAIIQLPDLPAGKSINQAALDLVQDRQIGASSGGRGVLILYVEKLRQVRIEVAYALEGVLPDAVVHRLEEAAGSYFLSDLSQDYFSELLITLSNVVKGEPPPEFDAGKGWPELSGGAGVRAAVASKDPAQVLALVRKLDPVGKQRFLPAGSPTETLNRYLQSLSDGIGEPNLPLLTEGSQVFRAVIPRSVAQQRRIARDYLRAGLIRIIENPKIALALYRANSSTLPIVLEQGRSGAWLVDEVKMWTYFHRFEDSADFRLLTDDNPFREQLMKEGYGPARCTIFKKRFTLSNDPLFEDGWFARAKDAYLLSLSQSPSDNATRWKLYHSLVNLSEMPAALEQLEALYKSSPSADRELREWRFGFRALYREAEAMAAVNPVQKWSLRLWNRGESAWKLLGDLFLPENYDPCLRLR